MGELGDGSVELVVTSPPYWQLKDYGSPEAIGFHDSYSDYIDGLNLVWRECARVLAPGCRLCVNIGDQFARAAYYGRYKVIPIRTEIIRFCETAGLDYMGAVIWHKVSTTNTTGGASVMGSFPFPRNGILKLNYEFILFFKKPGSSPPPSEEAKAAARMTAKEWNEWFSGHWTFPGEKTGAHLAAFPEELPRRVIRMFTFPGETVLDPFLGSGTTSVAAAKNGRNSVGYEINPGFLPLIGERLREACGDMFSPGSVETLTAAPACGFSEDLASLPYRFRDPLSRPLRRLSGRPAETYGSKIAGGEKKPGEFFGVAEVMDPLRLRLKDGRTLRLLGVTPRPGREEEARAYLAKAVGRGKIAFSAEGGDQGGEIPAYVHLRNKTFLNAKLIRLGLAMPYSSACFGKKERFMKIDREFNK